METMTQGQWLAAVAAMEIAAKQWWQYALDAYEVNDSSVGDYFAQRVSEAKGAYDIIFMADYK
jgi:hypothetical protein